MQANIASISNFFEIITSIASLAAILIGALWAYRLFWLKRQKYPRASIQCTVAHKVLTSETNLLNVTVDLVNHGEVLVKLKSGEIWLQQILPMGENLSKVIDDQREGVVKILRDLVPDKSKEMWQTEIAWPVIARYAVEFRSWHKKEIEPGNSLQLRYDFVLDQKISLIKVYAFYENAAKRPRTVERISWKRWPAKKYVVGWDSATLYELTSPKLFQ